MTAFAGYHQFPAPVEEATSPAGWRAPEPQGSFEVFYGRNYAGYELDAGYYWWPCFPGCLPDGDPSGPFPTAEGAYLDAIGE